MDSSLPSRDAIPQSTEVLSPTRDALPPTRDSLPPMRDASEYYPVQSHPTSFFQSFDSVFGQFDVAMKEMEEAMQVFDNFGSMREERYEPKYISPRDQLLKQPDSEYRETQPTRNEGMWTSPMHQSPLRMFFGFGSPDHIEIDSPRSSFITDQSDEISPAEGRSNNVFKYSGDEDASVQPTSNVHYTYTSINRVQRPDGKIEERRTFKDSSGKEEVTVTEVDPNVSGPLVSPEDLPFKPMFPMRGFFW